MNADKIKVIYILGSGYCGSTLLDKIIGTSGEAISTGEIAFYQSYLEKDPVNISRKKFLCGCGEPFNECSFWNDVRGKKHFKTKKRFSPKESFKATLSAIKLNILRFRIDQDDSYNLFKQVLEVSGKSIIIDSSKDPRRLYQLSFDNRFELMPLVLLRDGRAILNSYENRSRKYKNQLKSGFFSIVFARWFVVYYVSLFLSLRFKKRVVLKFEEFCQVPTEKIDEMNRTFGTSINTSNYINLVNEQEYHNIDGNRLGGKKVEKLELRENWKQELSLLKKMVAYIITKPLYSLSGLFK